MTLGAAFHHNTPALLDALEEPAGGEVLGVDLDRLPITLADRSEGGIGAALTCLRRLRGVDQLPRDGLEFFALLLLCSRTQAR